ncbi:MAG TPA: phenylalanine--tRNA ligase subunit alpha [Miltoncostaeaceae bacterium]|nr:phenylalanine--tRNA ligase subunit alpha [Miltoncostaeaceae bacterium]
MSTGDLGQMERDALEAVRAAASLSELEAARVAHTGRRSRLAAVLAGIGSLPPEDRGPVGRAANAARAAVEAALEERQAELEAEELGAALERDTTDVTLPGDPHPRGALHPITQIRREMEDIFLALGYFIADGPEVETDWHNFTALNTPEGHPARSSSDNFYVTGRPDRLLRSQTSPVQVRVMQEQRPPLYLVAPGFVYRRDDVDATHSPMFQQMEGLAVDEGLTMAHLKGTMLHFARELLGADREIVLHPHFFPFTEPSVDVQVSYVDKAGKAGWLELAGAGMVDPNVLSACGIDPERSTGFAFGWGLDRIAMIRFGVPDLRLFHENDLRFLEQFA